MKKILLILVLFAIAAPTMTVDAKSSTKQRRTSLMKKVGRGLLDDFVTGLEQQTGKNLKHHKKGTELQDLPKGYRPESRLEKLNKHYRNGGKPGTFDGKKEMKKEKQRRARAERRQAKQKK